MEEKPPLSRASVDLGATVEGTKIDPAVAQITDKINQAAQPATQAVKFPQDKAVPLAQVREGGGHPRPTVTRTAGFVIENSLAAGFVECATLQIEVLILGRDKGIPDKHLITPDQTGTLAAAIIPRPVFRFQDCF